MHPPDSAPVFCAVIDLSYLLYSICPGLLSNNINFICNNITSFFYFHNRANEPALSDSDQEELEVERADRSLFVQDLIVSSLGSISITDPSHKSREMIKELCSHQESEEGAFGGGETGETLHCDKPESTSILDTNEDIQVISLETEDDKDS